MVPIHKKLETHLARVQVLRDHDVVQLVSFLDNFPLGRCMNFVLRETNVFESFSRSGKYYIRLVDAKFALPKSTKEPNNEFICLDAPEYPAEHDDITLGFETEHGKQLILFRNTYMLVT